jgi:hypothetical protein
MNGEGLIIFSSIARGFTGMITDSATDTWKRIFLFDQLPGFPKFSLSCQNHKAFDIVSRRAYLIAGRGFHDILGFEIPPCPCFVPEHRSQRDGDGRDILKSL